MKSYRKELWFETKKRRELINITPTVTACLGESGVSEGFLLCNAMHITASVFVNDDEPGLHSDFEVWLEGLAPENPTPAITITAMRTMPTPTSSGPSWGAR